MLPPRLLVAGTCAPERRRYVHALAAATRRPAVPWVPSRTGGAVPTVAEVAPDADLAHLAHTHPSSNAIVCVVDGRHLRADLRDETPLIDGAALGDDRGDTGARARQLVRFIEAADLVAVVAWDALDTDELSRLLALLAHLNPSGRVRLSRHVRDDVRALAAGDAEPVPVLERAGWVRMLNDEHDPHLTDPDVSTHRYHELRPFHPARLVDALAAVEQGAAGDVVRSAGFVRLATRADILARWEQVGGAMWLDPLTSRMDASATAQDLAFTGIGVDRMRLFALLDAATLSDAELASGPDAWRRLPDPLPRWPALVESPAE